MSFPLDTFPIVLLEGYADQSWLVIKGNNMSVIVSLAVLLKCVVVFDAAAPLYFLFLVLQQQQPPQLPQPTLHLADGYCHVAVASVPRPRWPHTSSSTSSGPQGTPLSRWSPLIVALFNTPCLAWTSLIWQNIPKALQDVKCDMRKSKHTFNSFVIRRVIFGINEKKVHAIV